MGAKYIPTIKDLKAAERFRQKQNAMPKFKKNGGVPLTKKAKKK